MKALRVGVIGVTVVHLFDRLVLGWLASYRNLFDIAGYTFGWKASEVLRYGDLWYGLYWLAGVLVTYALIGLSAVAIIDLARDAAQPAGGPWTGNGSVPAAPVARPVPPQPVPVTSPVTSPAAYDQLERIHRLHLEGALTDAEFEAEKRRLLA